MEITEVAEFMLSYKYCGLTLSVTAKVEEQSFLLIAEPDRESTEQRNDICCAAIEKSAQQIAAQAIQAHREFLKALDQANLEDRRAYLKASAADPSSPKAAAPISPDLRQVFEQLWTEQIDRLHRRGEK